MKKLFGFLFSRVFIVGVSIVLQAAVLIVMIWRFLDYFVYFYALCVLLSVGAVLYIVSDRSNPAYKIAWIIPILVFPIFGGLFYLMFGRNNLRQGSRHKVTGVKDKTTSSLKQDISVIESMEHMDKNAANQSKYIWQYSLCPVYEHTYTEYLSPGEVKFKRMLEELEKAEKYIFLEYFIIEEGKMWDTILNVLIEKASHGVDVRVIYDDMGCMMLLPVNYPDKLKRLGIKCCVFNPFVPALVVRMNNRDHRKIAVIDGKVAFTGGINLADEYINAIEKHGHWKDASLLMRGDAAWSFTVMFLSLWEYINKADENYEKYRPAPCSCEANGYVQPFTDSPFDGESVGENVYLNIISKAKDYVYICTPYLIIDNEMVTILSNAAKSGVDVRIITPHIGDKWFVHAVTRSNYRALIDEGVKIYEYTPGFIHAKTFVADDEYAVVGTINLDYRSLYLHFECGAWMYKTKSVAELKADFTETLKVCQQMTSDDLNKVKWYVRLVQSILRIFAPLM